MVATCKLCVYAHVCSLDVFVYHVCYLLLTKSLLESYVLSQERHFCTDDTQVHFFPLSSAHVSAQLCSTVSLNHCFTFDND